MLWAVRAWAALALLTSARNLDYAPTSGHVCPAQFLRNAKGLSQEEAAYISNRLPVVRKALYDFLSETGFPDFNLDALFDKGGVPKVAFAASGGGLRAMLVGGSIMRALDSRTQVGTGLSTLGGLLQGSSYMTGLSGGSWLVASSVTNDFATVDELAHKVWSLNTAMTPPKRGFFTSFRYFASILDQIRDKAKHFKVTIVDFWSRGIIAYHVLGRKDGQIRAHWSQTTELASFKNFNMPYPIVLSLFRPRGGSELQLNASVMEMSPYEFGTWDAPFHAFAKTKNIGTKVFNGKPVDPNDCVEGYDNVGFIIGMSSSLFCASMSNNLDGKIVSELQRLLDKDDYDVGIIPNLFKGLPGLNPELADDEYLTLVDGGLAQQNIPLWPLLQKNRHVDIILAADASADTDDHWPDGSELYHTYQRLTDPKNTLATPVSMPSIPRPETFIKLGLNKKITFFGCGDINKDPHTPLIVYIPNHQKNFATNFSTFDDKYSKEDVQRIFDNGLAIATNDGDLGFRTCMSCAVILNSLIRSKLTPPTVCAECFEKHCWSLPS